MLCPFGRNAFSAADQTHSHWPVISAVGISRTPARNRLPGRGVRDRVVLKSSRQPDSRQEGQDASNLKGFPSGNNPGVIGFCRCFIRSRGREFLRLRAVRHHRCANERASSLSCHGARQGSAISRGRWTRRQTLVWVHVHCPHAASTRMVAAGRDQRQPARMGGAGGFPQKSHGRGGSCPGGQRACHSRHKQSGIGRRICLVGMHSDE